MKIPPNYGPDYTRRFEALFPALAEKHDVALIPFLLEGVAAKPELNLPDGIHPNAEGYEIVVETVLRTLLPLL
jgi:acyl-CoA thioesterase-1